MTRPFFVTGTDTDAGKTYVSAALLRGLALLNKRAAAFKPIASGVNAEGLNTDALSLQQVARCSQSVSDINPITFVLPTAPHLAAAAQGQMLSVATMPSLPELTPAPDYLLVEGAGGWLLPLNANETLADWVIAKRLPVLLVVGVKLGCLNHSLLTLKELERQQVPVLGYVANILSPHMHYLGETLASLTQLLSIPCLAELPFASEGPSDALCLQLAKGVATRLATPIAAHK